MQLPMPIGNWHYLRRIIGNVADSIIEPQKNNYNCFLWWNTKNNNDINRN